MNNEDNGSSACKAFVCCLIFLAAMWEVYDWYGKTYCENTAIPVLCSKE